MSARRVTLGHIAGVHGVKGWVRLHSLTRPIENLLRYRRWWITGQGRTEFEAQVVAGHLQGRGLVAQITGADGQPIEDRNLAAALIGTEIQVDRADMPKLPKGRYYWVDLIGLKVENVEGIVLGTVRDMTSNGPQDVLVLEDGEVERLIPFVPQHIVKDVDLAAGRIVCDWQREYDED